MVTLQHQRHEKYNRTNTNGSDDASLQQKAEEINLELLQPDVNLWKLREFALSEGGLVNDTLRKRAWPKLVGLHKYYKYKPNSYKPKPQTTDLIVEEDASPKFEFDTSAMMNFEMVGRPDPTTNSKSSSKNNNSALAYLIAESMDAEQIERDVARCTWHLLTGSQRSRRVQIHNKHRRKVASILRKKQKRLANLINLTLVESYELAPSIEDRLRYYQGYHDVACIFLHALGGGNTKPDTANSKEDKDKLGLELPARVLCQVSYSHFRDHLRSDFISLQTALRVALFPLLACLDRPVHDHLRDCDMEPFFCLSWVLTWFSHDVRDTELVKRLFDVFLCSHPLFPLYVSIAMLVHPINRQQILATDCDFAALHQCLVMLPRNSCRVGWKRRWDGEGYVSDEEDDTTTQADDMTASTGMDSSFRDGGSSIGAWGGDSVVEERSMSLATSASLAQSGTSVTSSYQSFSVGPVVIEDSYDKVPFQELIEQALAYMRRFPPRCIVNLAKTRYFTKDEWNLGDQVMNISLLQNPPTWSLASTAKADWVLKQRVRQDLGLKATSRRDRRRKLKMKQQQTARAIEDGEDDAEKKKDPAKEATPLVDMDYLKSNKLTLSVIAVGYGPDPVDPSKKKRKKQMRMAVAVAVAAILVGIVYRRYALTSSSTSTVTPVTPVIVSTTDSSNNDGSNTTSATTDSSHVDHSEVHSAPSASPSASSHRIVESSNKPARSEKPAKPEKPPRFNKKPKIASTQRTVPEVAKQTASSSSEPSSPNLSSLPTTVNDKSADTKAPVAAANNNKDSTVSLSSSRPRQHGLSSPALNKNPTIVVLKKTTQSIVRIIQHLQHRIFMPVLRLFGASGQKMKDGVRFILALGTLGEKKTQ